MKKILPYLAILFPVLLAFGYFVYYAVDTPWFDDIEAIPAFLLDFFNAPNSTAQFELLLKPNNEHRILFTKLMALLSVGVFQKINFVFLMLVGNVCILGILYLFWHNFKAFNGSVWLFVPVSFMLFQPHYHLLSFWSITSLQHQPTILFVFGAIYLLATSQSKSSNNFTSSIKVVVALIVLTFATFSMSNGMFGWPAGLVVLAFQKRWKTTIVWAMVMVLSIFLYFRGFDTQANQAGLSYFFQHPFKTILAFFAFIGGSADLIPSRFEPYRFGLPIVIGFGLFVGFCSWFWLLLKQYFSTFRSGQSPDKQSSFLLGAFAYILVNALIVALLRPRFGFGVLVVSNYKLYPTIFLCLCYLCLVQKFSFSTFIIRLIICISLIFNILCYVRFTPEVQSRQRNLMAASYNQANNQVGLGAMVASPLQPYIAQVMSQLTKQNLYQYPQFFDIKNIKTRMPLGFKVDESTSHIAISCASYISQGHAKNDGLYMTLTSAKHTYIFASMPIPYTGKNPFKTGKGVIAFIQKPILFPGNYQVGFLEKKEGLDQLMITNSVLKL